MHAFTTRQGGVSEGPFASLNLGLSTGDDPEKVRRNRERLAQALGFSWEEAAQGEQVHGTKVAVANFPGEVFPATDGLLTVVPGIPLVALFADCVPIFLVDKAKRVAGIVHSGWRGTAQKIVLEALALMQKYFSSSLNDCLVVLGPAIGPCCYLIGEEVAEQFASWKGKVLVREGGGWRLDLREANRQLVLEAGVPQANVEVLPLCTSCHPELFFSHRRDGSKTGRMAGVVMLK
ncbi:peptidoglycan editing factor PgeF [Ammonifex thiophilus]|nr:peptidoglycan editing factor PgeF [Ammonifex thiophilus]